MTAALCFYEVDRSTAQTVLQQIQQRCSELELVSYTVEESKTTPPGESYEVFDFAQGPDRVTIVVGFEAHPAAPETEYCIVVEPDPKSKRGANQLHEMVLPLIEELVNEARNSRSSPQE